MSCCIFFHKWGKWSEPEAVIYKQPDAWDFHNNPTHYKLFQEKVQGRSCLDCGEYQEREV